MVIPSVCPLVNRGIITCGPHQSHLASKRAASLDFRVAGINRFMPFRQSALGALCTWHMYISPIKGSSPPTRTGRSLIGSSCACAWALRETGVRFTRRERAPRVLQITLQAPNLRSVRPLWVPAKPTEEKHNQERISTQLQDDNSDVEIPKNYLSWLSLIICIL